MEISTEPIEEGGLNSYVHIVPKASRHGNLVLKRGIIAMESDLTDWCKSTLQGDLSTLIEPKTVLVQLLNEKGEVACMWRFNNAYPVKWVVDNLSSTKNDLVIESIELAYSFSTREK
jgi:phage tail-like protein